MFSGCASVISISLPVTAASPISEPTSMKSVPIVWSVPCSFATPSIDRILEPIPVIFAPIEFSMLHRSWTCGSLAAFNILVVPIARTAAISAFSVPVTDASSRNISFPTSLFAVNLKLVPISILLPSSDNARKCVSSLLLPITSPPGGGSWTSPHLARSGPANNIDVLIFFPRSALIMHLFIFPFIL